MKITPAQEKHYNSIRWLLFGARGSGRTWLLAKVYVEYALEHECEVVHFHDHWPFFESVSHLRGAIQARLNNISVYKETYITPTYKMKHNSFMITGWKNKKKGTDE